MGCCEELTCSNFYVSVFLEGLAVAFFVFIGGSSFIKINVETQSNLIETSIVMGLTLAVLSQCLKDVSGSHLNPAISLACMLTRRVSLIRGICYVIFQCGGGILGALALREMVPSSRHGDLAMTTLSPNLSLVKGIGYELIFSFIYAWVYFASKTSRDTFKGFGGPLAIGLFYGVSHIIIYEYTGCSLNPARSLGPAVIKEKFEDHWIYWAGPILAASLAGLLHDFVFMTARNKMYPRPRSCSLTCCKPSREEATLTDFSQYTEEPMYYKDVMVRNPSESGV